jgi:chlorite dismutase
MSIAKGCGIVALIGFLALGGIGYCGYKGYTAVMAEMTTVETEIKSWTAKYNSDQYALIFKSSDPQLSLGATEEQLAGKLAKLKEQFGNINLGNQVGFNMNIVNGDTKVVSQYEAKNDKGNYIVTFTLHKSVEWKMCGFDIRSKL